MGKKYEHGGRSLVAHIEKDLFFFFFDVYPLLYLFIFGCTGSSLLHVGFL